MLFHEFIHLTYNYEDLVNYLNAKKVLRKNMLCPRCDKIRLKPEESLIMHCTNMYYKQIRGRKRQRKTCNFKLSAITETWFAKAHLDLIKICRIISYFLMMNSPRQKLLETKIQISRSVAVDWVNFCRELLNQWVTDNSKPLSGPGIIVEIDEAKFGRRKYHKGRLITGQWLFGGVERHNDRLFVVSVPDRTLAALIPIIRRYIASGSIIYSDCWRAYDALCKENYLHQTVNHSRNFVDRVTRVYTQNIERLW
ncbi:uncharacterized protein LOC116844262 [Odontomachus brunneus]|uniref:uncharacterized protein LOC116844262 n=1 Tax=Odontomachus brunneus TaxID=486640 RepID=UPI0013F28ABB|nr:uncharacterized protein LOC116844262 [Odontomachus brunneus]